MPKRFFQILAPTVANDGTSYEHALYGFRLALFDHAGGYTEAPPVKGAWRSPTGIDHRDEVIPFNVAVDGPEVLADILMDWFHKFPDQQAVFLSSGEWAWIRERPASLEDLRAAATLPPVTA